jgi:hypothetical protein
MDNPSQLTRRLLACGLIAGPIYIVVGAAQILTRPGFDITRHPLSMLSLGEIGWIQTANFLASGALVVLGAVGLARAQAGDRLWRAGAAFVGLYGLGVFGGGLFATDASLGFPPGTRDTYPTTISWHALAHFISGQLGFLALIIATFVFAWRFARERVFGWALYSAFTGAVFLASIAVGVAAMGAAWTMLALYAAVALVWVWLSLLAARSLRRP